MSFLVSYVYSFCPPPTYDFAFTEFVFLAVRTGGILVLLDRMFAGSLLFSESAPGYQRFAS